MTARRAGRHVAEIGQLIRIVVVVATEDALRQLERGSPVGVVVAEGDGRARTGRRALPDAGQATGIAKKSL